MQIAKQCFLLLILATAALFMPHAKASCETPNIPALLSLSSISVPSSLPVGEAIPGTERSVHVAGECLMDIDVGVPIIACYNGFGKEIPGISGVYATGVSGVGVALRNEQGQRVTGAADQICPATTPVGKVASDGSRSFSFDVTLELVKTSETVDSGSLTPSNTQFNIGVQGQEGVGYPNTISYSGDVQVKAVTCTVTPPSITVTLGDLPLSSFTGAGKIIGQKNTDITITCDQNVQPELMIASANGYESDYAGVIKLTPESGVATGVGVRLLFNGQVPKFDTYMTTSPAYANVPLPVPFSVAYEQTAANVTPGPANAVATITLGYK